VARFAKLPDGLANVLGLLGQPDYFAAWEEIETTTPDGKPIYLALYCTKLPGYVEAVNDSLSEWIADLERKRLLLRAMPSR
jgi:hypothetical protein